jgi:hypothetical protein
MSDLLGGRIDMYVVCHPRSPRTSMPASCALATTGTKRSSTMPDVPTIAESGYPGFEATNWYAFVAPGRTPKELLDFWNREITKALNDPHVRAELAKHGLDPAPGTRDELAQYFERESQKWSRGGENHGRMTIPAVAEERRDCGTRSCPWCPCKFRLSPITEEIRRVSLLESALVRRRKNADAVAAGQICTSADTFMFGNRAVGSSTTANATVINCGDAPWSFSDVSASGHRPAFHVSTTCATGLSLARRQVQRGGDVRANDAGTDVRGVGVNTTSTPDQLIAFYGRGVDGDSGRRR